MTVGVQDVETVPATDDVRPDVSLAIRRDAPQVELQDTLQIAEVFVKSGFFADSVKLSQAAVKIMAGREFGFGPFASMRGLYIISGRVAMEANLMAQAIKRGGKYNYRVVDLTDQGCTIDFYERGQKIGTSTFSKEDAKKAGTKNMEKFPRNMLFARALSNGAKWYTPDAFGAPVYSPDELGMTEREDGTFHEPVPAEVVQAHVTEPKRKSETTPATATPEAGKPYRITAVEEGNPVVLVTEAGRFSATPEMLIPAKSALQSKAQVILEAAVNGVVTSIEEME